MTGLQVVLLCSGLVLVCQQVALGAPGGNFTTKLDVLAADTPCIQKQKTGLTLKDLQRWLTSVTKELPYTYITPDSGKTLYKAGTVQAAVTSFLSGASKPKSVLASNSPCITCTASILNVFKNKPFKLYISHLYSGSEEEMKCMAKMMYYKFSIQQIDWNAFSKSFVRQCRDLVEQTLNFADFKEAQAKLANQISEIKKLSTDPNVKQFCT